MHLAPPHIVSLGFFLISAALKDAVTRARAEEIIIPFGIGIAGMVAQTKEMINIKEAYQDARFNCEIDLKTGYKTNAILCMPICNYEGDIIGVAQIINKTNGKLPAFNSTAFSSQLIIHFIRQAAWSSMSMMWKSFADI